MKHVIVRGQAVKVLGTGKNLSAAGIEVPRGSLVVRFETVTETINRPNRAGRLPFVASIVGEPWLAYGADPIEALLNLSTEIMKTGSSDNPVGMPGWMRFIREEI